MTHVSEGVSATDLFMRHEETLDAALAAIRDRGYWSRYPELPGAYDEDAPANGRAAFDARLGARLELDQPGTLEWVGGERTPYGIELGVTYPRPDLDALLGAMSEAMPAWRDAGPERARRRRARDPGADQSPVVRARARGHAHDRPGVHDGVPGGRPARPGPRAGGDRVRARRDDKAPGRRRAGRSRRASATRSRWTSGTPSCRAGSAS